MLELYIADASKQVSLMKKTVLMKKLFTLVTDAKDFIQGGPLQWGFSNGERDLNSHPDKYKWRFLTKEQGQGPCLGECQEEASRSDQLIVILAEVRPE